MSFFCEAGLTASRAREKFYFCEKCGIEMVFTDPDVGYCCPKGHGCSWPQAQRDPPEPNKARCYHQGEIIPTGQSKGRSRKQKPKRQDFSGLFMD